MIRATAASALAFTAGFAHAQTVGESIIVPLVAGFPDADYAFAGARLDFGFDNPIADPVRDAAMAESRLSLVVGYAATIAVIPVPVGVGVLALGMAPISGPFGRGN